jgi:pyruvate dehydrogenase E1 component alpha subunit
MERHGLSDGKLLEMYKRMVLIREFETKIHYLFLEGTMPGTIHLYYGQEAVAVGVCANLTNEDMVTSTHRPHGHCLAKGVSVKSAMAELFAKTTGCCKAKGGSMHMGDFSVGMVPAIAIVGGNIPIATGIALAMKFQKKGNVAVSFFGEGATNEGAFHEAINMGAIWNLPVIYVCENNFYGASTHMSKVLKINRISERASAYGIPGATVDGNDLLEVYRTAKQAIERARNGEGPTLIECLTYRRGGHSRRDANLYRDKKEEAEWMARDPIVLLRDKLSKEGIANDGIYKNIEKEVQAEIDDAVSYAKNSPDPQPQDALTGLWA